MVLISVIKPVAPQLNQARTISEGNGKLNDAKWSLQCSSISGVALKIYVSVI